MDMQRMMFNALLSYPCCHVYYLCSYLFSLKCITIYRYSTIYYIVYSIVDIVYKDSTVLRELPLLGYNIGNQERSHVLG